MYQAKYFDGILPEPYVCNVTFNRQQISIEYKKEYTTKTEVWNLTDIERTDLFDNGKVVISRTGKPIQSILFENRGIIEEFKREKIISFLRLKNHFHKPGKALWTVLGITISVVFLLFALYFKGLPIIAEKIAMKFPYSTEKKIGEQLYKSNLSGQKIDSVKSIYAKMFFDSLHLENNENITITILKSREINAYAMPGGHIVVYDSILTLMETPEEFASLLAHEYAHIKLRHSLRGIVRQAASTLFFSLIFGDAQGTAVILAENADKLKSIQYTREMEQQADEEGLICLIQNNINPSGMLELFKKLDKSTGSITDKASEFLSTHPLFKTRMGYIEEKIKTIELKKNYKNNFPGWDKLTSRIK